MRWYDDDELLRTCLDGLRELSAEGRHHAVTAAIGVMAGMAPGFMDEHVAEFDLPSHGNRRWYDDDDADTWLLFHALEQSDEVVRGAVALELTYHILDVAA